MHNEMQTLEIVAQCTAPTFPTRRGSSGCMLALGSAGMSRGTAPFCLSPARGVWAVAKAEFPVMNY